MAITITVPAGEAAAASVAPSLIHGYTVPSGAATAAGSPPKIFSTAPIGYGYIYYNGGIEPIFNTGVAVGYIYENIGIGPIHTKVGHAYIYENVGIGPVNSKIGYNYIYEGDVDNSTPTPHIWFLRPTSGREGDGFSIYGHGFGDNNAQYTGHAYLDDTQLSETAWQRIPAGSNAYTAAREIDALDGEPTMEHGRIDVVIPNGAVSGIVTVETDAP